MKWDELSEYEQRNAAGALTVWWWIKRGGSIAVVLVLILMLALPQYFVWQRGLAGKSELKQAEWNRQIAIEEAQARRLAAVELAQAEIERAKRVAEANKIIAEGLGGPEGYLRYLWIQSLTDGKSDVIYVPTEAQIPILEAGRALKE